MPYVIGQLDRLLEPALWAGDDNDQYNATQGIEHIINALVTEQTTPPGGTGVLYQEHTSYILNSTGVVALGFDLLPSDWKRCRIEIVGRVTVAGEQDLYLRFNYDDTNNYGYHSSVLPTSIQLSSGDETFIRVSDALTGSNRGAGSACKTVIEITQPTGNALRTYVTYQVAGFYRDVIGSGYWKDFPTPISSVDIGVVYGEFEIGAEIDVFLGWDDE